MIFYAFLKRGNAAAYTPCVSAFRTSTFRARRIDTATAECDFTALSQLHGFVTCHPVKNIAPILLRQHRLAAAGS